MMDLHSTLQYLQTAAGHLFLSPRIAYGELSTFIPAQHLMEALTFLKEDKALLFSQLMDVCGVDFQSRNPRFQVVYNLLSLHHNSRIRLKVTVEENESLSSSITLFESAGWWEREVFDLFGIGFDNHPDLRRILTDYGFEGHPLRKDFPLSGYVEVGYDNQEKKVIYQPVNLPQAFRTFDFIGDNVQPYPKVPS